MLLFIEDDEFEYKDMLSRDRRRWEKADVNKDNEITKEEYTAFLHPEEYDHMKDVVIDETLQDIDKDGDGFVSLDEYLGKLLFCFILFIFWNECCSFICNILKMSYNKTRLLFLECNWCQKNLSVL